MLLVVCCSLVIVACVWSSLWFVGVCVSCVVVVRCLALVECLFVVCCAFLVVDVWC